MFYVFYPTASATAYGQRPKFVRAEHSATAEGENCAYGPTLLAKHDMAPTSQPVMTGSRTLAPSLPIPKKNSKNNFRFVETF